jgi:hypothetical protein
MGDHTTSEGPVNMLDTLGCLLHVPETFFLAHPSSVIEMSREHLSIAIEGYYSILPIDSNQPSVWLLTISIINDRVFVNYTKNSTPARGGGMSLAASLDNCEWKFSHPYDSLCLIKFVIHFVLR